MKRYESILKVITFIKTTYMFDITIKDFCGFVPANSQLDSILRPYLAHSSPYCLLVKNTQKGYMKCLRQKKALYKKCKELRQSFIGYCHAGVGELVVPILCDSQVIGSVNIANLSHNTKRAETLFKRTFSCFDSDAQQQARMIYADFMKPSPADISSILVFLELLAECLGEIAKNHIGLSEVTVLSGSSSDIMIHKIDTYLQENYAHKITVPEMALQLSFSTKAISATIQKIHGLSFNNYLNRIRIEKSENLLLKSNLSIDEVAQSVGFFDVPYFKKVFISILNISPEDFVRYYKNEKYEVSVENAIS